MKEKPLHEMKIGELLGTKDFCTCIGNPKYDKTPLEDICNFHKLQRWAIEVVKNCTKEFWIKKGYSGRDASLIRDIVSDFLISRFELKEKDIS